ncbi:hypothetical protein [Methyloversatilis discipulorum]|uniref:hypothetical protein n=1 Tax=Methyloversatilis discipulorum TaxID=1119528 RepID=UPI00036FFFE3|nr:hypothetical protein [Methyloversatilis discipulorum]
MDRIAALEERVERMGDLNAVLIAGLCAAVSQLRDSRSICTMNWRFDIENAIRNLPIGNPERRNESLQNLMNVIAVISASHRPAGQ